uniref:Degenerin-like protein unc-105 n=1 Tax=Gongylonema pulchrum TaxID=637853 RepID=A0A183DRR3_9BILA
MEEILLLFFRHRRAPRVLCWMKEKGPKSRNKNKFSGLGKIRVPGHLNYREIIRRFERQSTFHGISHAALAPNTKWRIIWYTAFTICFCALIIQIILLIRRYRLYAKTVDLDLKFENAPFPSVTLCNLNPYKASMIAKEGRTKATMDAFSSIVQSGVESYGISAAIEAARKEGNKPRRLRAVPTNITINRRYHQASAQCLCELNSLTGERVCKECSKDLGHCPMRFFDESASTEDGKSQRKQVCLCHREYNHCIANNDYGYILEIEPKTDISALDILDFPSKAAVSRTTTTSTTPPPELRQALGFEAFFLLITKRDGLTDEIAIKEQAKENLMFAVGEMNDTEKVQMSQQKHELIFKCSFNQKDCDIENDFKLHYDQTYGNCYTFNWNTTRQVTAHRAGANFGLRVLLYADVSEYLPTSESVGFRITVHDQWTVPFPDAFGYNAPTGFLSSFGVRMKKFKRIPAPHGQCLEDNDRNHNFIYHGFNYSVEIRHIQHRMEAYRANDPVARECIKNASQYLSHLIAEGKLEHCVCHQPCSEVNYEVTYSAARWPSGTTKVMECDAVDDLCMERYRKNAAMIQIFYEELNYETMTETPAYTITSALADLGGLTGLWIGASVVSLLEIAALIVYTVQAYVRKRKKSTKLPSFLDEIQPEPMKEEEAEEDEDEEEKDEEKDEAVSLVPKKSIYLPPGAELPCECIFKNGKLHVS